MSKAFTRENDDTEEEDLEPTQQLPLGLKNYITPTGYQRLKDEFDQLWKVERPALVKTIIPSNSILYIFRRFGNLVPRKIAVL